MMAGPEPTLSSEALIEELARTRNESEREQLVSSNPTLLSAEVVTDLLAKVVERVRVDIPQARSLAESAMLIAKKLGGKEEIATGLRARANALYASGDHKEAVAHHDQALELYLQAGNQMEAARTLSTSIHPLILMGEYDRAYEASEQARQIFTQLGDPWRIARLEINAGNIFHRQDRFEEALAHYERAYAGMIEHRDVEGIAVVLSNMAVCLISLNDFARALSSYRQARKVCEKAGMPLLVAQADYNVAYLYYLRGEYGSAIERLYAARRACEATGDAYHFALCHLDLSDVYLELNLSEEARAIAHEGFLRFEKLGMGYEAAKTLANEAMAFGQQGKTVQALERFSKAREMFGREKNLVWPWLIDLYQGLLLFHEGRYFEARHLCPGASAFFDQSALSGKAVLAHLLLARIALQVGDSAEAEKETGESLARVECLQTPVLAYQAHLLEGQIAHARNDRQTAHQAYSEARKALETLRTRLQGEELKISFVKNRLQVYEALVDLYLDGHGAEISADKTLACIEAAKSHSMIDMIFQSGQSLPLGEAGQSEYVRKIRDLRQELNWYYHRMELEQLGPDEKSRERIERLHRQVQSRESELLRALRELPAQERENATLESSSEFSVAELQTALPEDTALVEYYSAGNRLVAAIVTRESIEITPVTGVSRVAQLLHLLRFQLSTFGMGTSYAQRFEQPLLRATLAHLGDLYTELIAPLRARLRAQHLVFVPHGALHFLPFHALQNGDENLGDAYTISYAPSATVFAICQRKATSEKRSSLVLGIPDERAPHILTEVQSVAALLPHAELFLSKQATAEVLREKGPETGLLHIATHGIYRRDNPMFSGIRLGDGYVNLYDLYQMRLGAKLVTLSGCATGMNFVAAGDELIGLQRGLFCAGATSLLLSLWDVHDGSTAELMQEFYKRYIQSNDMVASLQAAMRDVRPENPHPYFWAPFELVGKVTQNRQSN